MMIFYVRSTLKSGRAASTHEGDELLAEWGNRADQNVAIVRTRLERMLANMTPDDKASTLAWFNDLTSKEAFAVMRALGGR